jgi:hypothetical protein
MLRARDDLSDQPMPGGFMSGRRKAVRDGARVKLPQGVRWQTLAQMTPDAIAEGDLLPAGFMPLPHVKQSQGGQVFPNIEIDTIRGSRGAKSAAVRRRFRFARPFHPGVPAPDLSHYAYRTGRRVPGKLAHHQELLCIDGGHSHAGTAGWTAPAADAVPPGRNSTRPRTANRRTTALA